MKISIIVEGHGETESLPILLRRIIADIDPTINPKMSKETVFRIGKGSLVRSGGVEKAAKLANIRLGGEGIIVLLMDSDGQCPAQLGPALLARLRSVCGHLKTTAIVAHQEYENWFIHASQSLTKRPDFENSISHPSDPDGIRDAKGWIAKHKINKKYSEILDQPSISANFDIHSARSSDSFDKFWRDINEFINDQDN